MKPRGGVPVVLLAALLVAGVCAAAPAFAAAPAITGFTPTSGKLDTPVTIAGTNFTSPLTVKFGGSAATVVTLRSTTSIVADVPPAATTGKITVTTPGGTATSAGSFTVTAGALLAPVAGPPSTRVTLTLSGFGASEPVDVYVDTTDVALMIADAGGRLTAHVTIPSSATPGAHYVSAVGRRTSDAAQASFVVRTDWAQHGFDVADTSTNPYENMLSPARVGQLTPRWRYNLGSTCTESAPTIAGGVAYFADCAGYLHAVNATTGTTYWSEQVAPAGTGQYSSPAVATGVLYVGYGNSVYGITAVNGHVRFAFQDPTGEFDASPRVVNGTVYVGSYADDDVFALDVNGNELWQADVGGDVFAAPAYADGALYVATVAGHLVELDASTGVEGFSETVADGYPIAGSPIVADGLVYVASAVVAAYDAQTGSQAWSQPLSHVTDTSPALDDGTVFVGEDDGTAAAFDAGDGTPVWSRTVSAADLTSPIAVADGVVYVGGAATYAISESTGARLRTLYANGYDGGAVIADGAVTVGMRSAGGLFSMVHYALPVSAQGAHRPDAARLRPDRALRPS